MIDDFDSNNTCSCCGEPFGSRSNHIAGHTNRKAAGLNAGFSFAGGSSSSSSSSNTKILTRKNHRRKRQKGRTNRNVKRSYPTKRRAKK